MPRNSAARLRRVTPCLRSPAALPDGTGLCPDLLARSGAVVVTHDQRRPSWASTRGPPPPSSLPTCARSRTRPAPRAPAREPSRGQPWEIERLRRTNTSTTGARLFARLEGDEPPENAEIITRLYVADPSRGRCRPLTPCNLAPTGGDTARRRVLSGATALHILPQGVSMGWL